MCNLSGTMQVCITREYNICCKTGIPVWRIVVFAITLHRHIPYVSTVLQNMKYITLLDNI